MTLSDIAASTKMFEIYLDHADQSRGPGGAVHKVQMADANFRSAAHPWMRSPMAGRL
jgi:hypothetical protein